MSQAHDQASHLELAIREELPQVRDIHSHIEPLAAPVMPVPPLDEEEGKRLRAQIGAIVNEVPELNGYNRLHIRRTRGGYDIVLHCLADPDLPVADAHRLADQVEKLLHVGIPGIKRVLVHLTPEGEIDTLMEPGDPDTAETAQLGS